VTPVPATGILLAAGRGRRFDPSGAQNKLLQALPGGELVVAASARAMLAALPCVLAVVRLGDDRVAAILRELGCEVEVAEDADSGMGASLLHAIRCTRNAGGWLIALGDMPHVHSSTIAALSAALAAGVDIAAPMYRGRRGNPVAFSRVHLPLLLALQGDQGARSILRQHPVWDVEVADAGVLQDVDTLQDLAIR
jgi:molybdenum cofactor cytidylyltransferase